MQLRPDRSPQDAIRPRYGEALFLDTGDRGVLVDVDRPPEYEDLVAARSE